MADRQGPMKVDRPNGSAVLGRAQGLPKRGKEWRGGAREQRGREDNAGTEWGTQGRRGIVGREDDGGASPPRTRGTRRGEEDMRVKSKRRELQWGVCPGGQGVAGKAAGPTHRNRHQRCLA